MVYNIMKLSWKMQLIAYVWFGLIPIPYWLIDRVKRSSDGVYFTWEVVGAWRFCPVRICHVSRFYEQHIPAAGKIMVFFAYYKTSSVINPRLY